MPTVYVSNWSSHRTAGHHGPGRKLTIMARPRAWEVGDGCVPWLTPDDGDLLAVKAGRISGEEYQRRFEAFVGVHAERGHLAPGSFRLDEVVVEELSADGDELQVLQVGDCVGRKKAPGVILTGSRAAVVRAARFLARKVRLHGVGS